MDFSHSMRSFLKIALLGMSSLQANGHVMSSPDPTITAAPNLHAQILERQEGVVTCTEWSFLGGGGLPVCNPGSSCYEDYYGSYAGCQAETAPAVGFITSCIDYGYSWDGVGDPASIESCPGTAPYCGTAYFFDENDNVYYNYGCGTAFYLETGTQVGPLAYATGSATGSATAAYSSIHSSTAVPSFTPIVAPSPTGLSATITAPSTTPTTSASSSSSGGGSKAAIIGGAVGGGVGGIAVIACCIFIFFCLRKRRQQKPPAPATYEAGIQGSMQSPIQAPQESSYKPPFSSVTEKSGKFSASSAC